jgi:hypothetical protein
MGLWKHEKKIMRYIQNWRVLGFLVIVAVAFSRPAPVNQEQRLDLPTLLDKITQRMESHAKNENWTLSVITTITRMDKNWKPEKVTLVDRKASINHGDLTEEIISATETEDGAKKDITEKYRKESAERRTREQREQEERKRKGTTDRRRQRLRLDMTEEDFLPFSAKNRPHYEFWLLSEASLDEKSVFVVAAKSRIKEDIYFEGSYYIDQESFDVLRAEVGPAKNPRFVKELEMTIDFQLLPQGYFVLKYTRVRINAGFFLKHVRMVVEEVYSQYEIPPAE